MENNKMFGAIKVRRSKIKKKELIFYICLIIFPMTQFAIMYLGVNINSILLAFQKYDNTTGNFSFLGFDNFSRVFDSFAHDIVIIGAMQNSLLLFGIGVCVGVPLNLSFAYFMYKKIAGNKIFSAILFLPQIISVLVLSVIFRLFVEKALPEIMGMIGITNLPKFLVDTKYAFGTIIFYCIWAGFGTQILVYTSAMSRINESLIEYGKLEGITSFKELTHVILPLIFPSISTFLIISVSGIFSNQAHLFDIYGSTAQYEVYTIGYFFFIKVLGGVGAQVEYPFAAASGLVFTAIVAPIVLLLRFIMGKISPTVEY